MSPLERQDLTFLFFAYAAVFVALFIFMVRMVRKASELEREVSLLREEYGEDGRSGRAPSTGTDH
jgi:CcmD family protein